MAPKPVRRVTFQGHAHFEIRGKRTSENYLDVGTREKPIKDLAGVEILVDEARRVVLVVADGAAEPEVEVPFENVGCWVPFKDGQNPNAKPEPTLVDPDGEREQETEQEMESDLRDLLAQLRKLSPANRLALVQKWVGDGAIPQAAGPMLLGFADRTEAEVDAAIAQAAERFPHVDGVATIPANPDSPTTDAEGMEAVVAPEPGEEGDRKARPIHLALDETTTECGLDINGMLLRDVVSERDQATCELCLKPSKTYSGRCTSESPSGPAGLWCAKPNGHAGDHQGGLGQSWPAVPASTEPAATITKVDPRAGRLEVEGEKPQPPAPKLTRAQRRAQKRGR